MTEAAASTSAEAHGAPKAGRLRVLPLAIGVILLIGGLLALLVGPLLFRAGLLGIETATAGVARIALWLVGASIPFLAFALAASAMGGKGRDTVIAIAGVTLALMVGFRIYSFGEQRASLPPIYDIQTDWSHPVAFSETTLQAREAVHAVPVRDDVRLPEGAGRWAGQPFARVQAEFYSVKPLLLPGVKPADATVAVADAAKRLKWNVMRSDPPDGEVEATTYSTWYGLAADIAVRVRPQGDGSRIDARSTSRTAGPDMGANEQRILTLLENVRSALPSADPPTKAGGAPKDAGSGAPL